MKTYGDVFALWQFVLSWILQAQPSVQQILRVNVEFTKLARAIVDDTRIQNFHHMNSIKTHPIGPATTQWLKDSRPILSNIYPFFGDQIEMILNPKGRIDPE